jgi:hypothetical protein
MIELMRWANDYRRRIRKIAFEHFTQHCVRFYNPARLNCRPESESQGCRPKAGNQNPLFLPPAQVCSLNRKHVLKSVGPLAYELRRLAP